MVIFMCGFPFSGKTHILELLKKEYPDTDVIDPKSYRDEEYPKLDEDGKREFNISAWQCSLELLQKTIENTKPDDLIAYDTACASDQMLDYMDFAKKYKHKVLVVYVNAKIDLCEKRAGKEWLSQEVVQKYKTNFKNNLLKFRKMADDFVIIDNNGDQVTLEKAVEKIDACGIHKSKSS